MTGLASRGLDYNRLSGTIPPISAGSLSYLYVTPRSHMTQFGSKERPNPPLLYFRLAATYATTNYLEPFQRRSESARSKPCTCLFCSIQQNRFDSLSFREQIHGIQSTFRSHSIEPLQSALSACPVRLSSTNPVNWNAFAHSLTKANGADRTLNNNQLSGPIPPELGNLLNGRLEDLYVGESQRRA